MESIDFIIISFYNRAVHHFSLETLIGRCMMSDCLKEAEETSKFCPGHVRHVQYAYRGKNRIENPWLLSTCIINGCEELTKTTTCRFCAKHYTRYFRHGDPSVLQRAEWRSPCKIDGCFSLSIGRGYCSKHYQRFMRNGDVSTNNSQGEKCRRFVRETVLPYSGDECLIWPFYRDPDGYAGKIRWNTRDPEAACRVIC